jgi:NADPH-dependent ferric siderophore reductase
MKTASNEQQAPRQIFTNAEVVAIKDITTSLRRFTFRDEKFKEAYGFEQGIHMKVLIPAAGQSKAVLPQTVAGKPYWPDPETQPVRRTYTIRRLDPEKAELDIEFVLHGDNGPASAWASKAEVNDYLGIGMRPGKALRPADWYLFMGDETAIPAIAAMLEILPEHAKGTAFLEVGSVTDTFEIRTPSAVQIRWLSREGEKAEGSDLLLNAIRDTEFPDPDQESAYVWMAGEAKAVKSIKDYARDELGLKQDELHAVVYWRAGTAEDELRR